MSELDFILAYESGEELSDLELLTWFSNLIKSWKVWSLQGTYGRMAKSLIDNWLISKEGEINPEWENII